MANITANFNQKGDISNNNNNTLGQSQQQSQKQKQSGGGSAVLAGIIGFLIGCLVGAGGYHLYLKNK